MARGTRIRIDQVVWDPATLTLHVESDQVPAQQTRFALIVTRGIHDQNGDAIEASDAFRRFRAEVREDYKRDLIDGIKEPSHSSTARVWAAIDSSNSPLSQ